jgi:hypothetical protein
MQLPQHFVYPIHHGQWRDWCNEPGIVLNIYSSVFKTLLLHETPKPVVVFTRNNIKKSISYAITYKIVGTATV